MAPSSTTTTTTTTTVAAAAAAAAEPAAAHGSDGRRLQVAMLQDQQLDRAEVADALGRFELLWPPFAAPTGAWALATDGRGQVTEEDLAMHPHCRVLAVAFVGTNHVDHEACRRRGITILNCPDYSSRTVAELTIGLTLSAYREIPRAERALRAGGWAVSGGGMEIFGKTVAVVGLGDIGLRVAELFRAFGPRELLGFSRSAKARFAELGGRQVGLEEIFERADIVVLSLLLTDETRGVVSRALMEKLRPSCLLVNIARAGLCDHEALVELLAQRRFRAALDVFPEEPLPQGDALLQVPEEQLVIVPHIGYKSVEALRRRLALLAENLRYAADGVPQNVVTERH